MKILGIDPGFAITGFGVIEYSNFKFKVIDYGDISTPSNVPFPKRLQAISDNLSQIIKTHSPDVMAIEKLFFNKNIKTAIDVSHGRGVSIVTAAQHDIPIAEYTPLQVKQNIIGYGRAEKAQIQQMVKAILCLSEIPKPDDVSDALAIAICHAHSYSSFSL